MLEWYRCPDGQNIPVKECLAYPYGSCRLPERCLTYPTLTKIAEEREWTGEPSTTQLLNGTMMEFLKLTQPYTVDPDSRTFALLGTRHHELLEEIAKTLNLPSEVALTGEDRDILDLLEPAGDGTYILTDYKTWGSYRVAKAIGLIEVGKKPDPNGAVYKTTTKWGKAGSIKQVSVFQEMPSETDNFEAELQLNHYRILFEEKCNRKISKMRIQATIRDGGLAVARGRGLDRNTKMITVARLNDGDVLAYFREKRKALLLALEQGSWTSPCNEQECWDGVRCQSYCDVAMFCPKGMLHQQEVK